MLKKGLLYVLMFVLAYSMAPTVFAADSSYPANLDGLFKNEVYEKMDNVNDSIGKNVSMTFPDFLKVGSEIWAYYISSNAQGKLVINLAKSTDGLNWTDYGMVLDVGAAGQWDDGMAAFPGIWKDGSTYYLVYEGSGTGTNGDIGLATSTDGVNFTRQGRILTHQTTGWESINIGTPSLYKEGATWYLFYHGFDMTDCQVGFASGTSLTSLTRSVANPVLTVGSSGIDAGTIGRRGITKYNGTYYMVYEVSSDTATPGDYGKANWSHAFAKSTDLTNWTKMSQKNLVPIGDFHLGHQFGNDGPTFLELDGITWIYARDTDYGVGHFAKRSRLANELNGGYDRKWEAESMYHQVGRADGDGWSANTVQDASPGYLTYGPYVTDVMAGDNVAVFKAMIDNNTANNDVVMTLEVYDATSNTVLAQRNITRQQFYATSHYEFFSVPFSNEKPGNQLEFRLYWPRNSFLKADRVFVNSSFSSDVGEVKQIGIDDKSGSITYSGAWSDWDSNTANFNGTEKFAGTSGAYAEFSFTGKSVSWIGAKENNSGKADVYIDGVFQKTVDTYAATPAFQQILFSKSWATSGAHTIKVVATGTKHASSSNTNIVIDKFQYGTTNTAFTTLDDKSGSITYSGTWSNWDTNVLNYAGTEKFSSTTSSYAQITFTGTEVKWIGTKESGAGKANVYLDGVLVSTVDQYAPNGDLSRQLLYSATGLANTSHTLKVEVSGWKNTASGGYTTIIDKFEYR